LLGALPGRAAALDEAQIGAHVYQELAKRGEIVDASPWYGVLNQVGRSIAAQANSQYDYPFHFVLVREKQPNAFSVPGGNVYVTLPLMTLVQTEDELAGVLSHEVSHDIHHDVVHLAQKQETTGLLAVGLQILLGGRNPIVQNAIGIGAELQDLHYSRDIEESADHLGAQICAHAGYDPWGLVWMFQKFSKSDASGMEMLSDHPTDQHRIAMLESEFRSDPGTFARFSSRPSGGHKMPAYAYLSAHYGNARPAEVARRPGY
jgi:predicted Zn-dependent protease